MGGCPAHRRCYALGCTAQATTHPHLKFHHFPTNPVRCKEWVKLSGNINLTLDGRRTLVNCRALCSKHFTNEAYKVLGDRDSNLNPNALPKIFLEPPLLDTVFHKDFPRPDSECLPQGATIKAKKVRSRAKKSESPKKRSQSQKENVYHFGGGSQVNVTSSSLSPQVLSHQNASHANVSTSSLGVGDSSPSLPLSNECSVLNLDLQPVITSPLRELPCDTNVNSTVHSTENVSGKKRRLDDSGNESYTTDRNSRELPPTPNDCSLLESVEKQTKKRRLEFNSPNIVVSMSTPLYKPVPGPSRSLFSNSFSPVLNPMSISSSSGISQYVSGVKADASIPTPRKSKGRKTVFSQYQLHRGDVTPKKKKIIDDLKQCQRHVRALQRSIRAVKNNRDVLLKQAKQPLVTRLRASLKTKEAAVLFQSQMNNRGKKPSGFRWSLEEKTLALTLYKGSRKNYRFLRKILNLPSAVTLNNLMSRIKFETGNNRHFFQHLGELVKKMSAKERAVVLMWDEVQIRKSVQYNEAKDRIEGYLDHADGKSSRTVANKCLVFMVQSLAKRWKQPVAYYFSEDETPAKVLVKLIVNVIVNLQDVGFDVRASVSDQGGNNVAAVNSLRNKFQTSRPKSVPMCPECKKKKAVFRCAKKGVKGKKGTGAGVTGSLEGGDGQTIGAFSRAHCRVCRANALRPVEIPYYRINKPINIYHLWDVPHLLKNTRNNFLQYDVETQDGVARWKHLQKLRDMECYDGTFYHLALKLTDNHLKFSRNSDKMKVKTAAQLLSRRVAAALKMVHKWSNGRAIPGSLATAAFIYFVDQLFDSFNGPGKGRSGKPLKTNLSDKSAHFEFWEEAERQLKKWYFKGSTRIFAFHRGWLENITAVKGLWGDLKDDLKFEFLNLRRLNQDPLENLFSVIKQNHKIPTVPQFISGLKTAIITNLKNSGIVGANCEDDEGSLLSDLNVFFKSASGEGLEDDQPSEEGGNGKDSTSFADDEAELAALSSALNGASLPVMEQSNTDPLPQIRIKREPIDNVGTPHTSQKADALDMDDAFDILFGGGLSDLEAAVIDVDSISDDEDDCEIVEDFENGVPVSPVNGPNSSPITLDTIPEIVQRKDKRRKVPLSEEQEHQKAVAAGKKAIEKENKGLCGHRRKVTGFVCGYIVKKVIIRIEKCEECEKSLVTDKITPDHDLVVALERDDVKQRLTYASKNAVDITVSCVDIFLMFMFTDFHRPSLKSSLCEKIMLSINFSSLGCASHATEVQRFFLLYFCRVSIYHRCRIMNRELAKECTNRQPINTFKVSSTNKAKTPALANASPTAERLESEGVDDPSPASQPKVRGGEGKGTAPPAAVPHGQASVVRLDNIASIPPADPGDPMDAFLTPAVMALLEQYDNDVVLPDQPPLLSMPDPDPDPLDDFFGVGAFEKEVEYGKY